nr:hypothetical protein [Tanacetum cinerariifolium]
MCTYLKNVEGKKLKKNKSFDSIQKMFDRVTTAGTRVKTARESYYCQCKTAAQVEKFWDIEEDKNDSWGWRNILKQRNEVRSFIVNKIGDGSRTSLWFDNWSNIGPLNQFISHRNMYDARLSHKMTVKEWVEQCNGQWPEEWVLDFLALLDLETVSMEEQNNDCTMWRETDGILCIFSVSQAYRDLIHGEDDVDWYKVIWYSQNIPKHAFISWLAIHNKLTTQDKIKQWGSYDVMCCALCKHEMDSHSHLFFKCEYSKVFWGKILKKMGVFGSTYKWNDLVVEMSRRNNGNSVDSVIRRLCFAASVYLILQERKNRIFRDECKSIRELIKVLSDIVRMRLLSLKFKRSTAVIKAQERWDVKLCIVDTHKGVFGKSVPKCN